MCFIVVGGHKSAAAIVDFDDWTIAQDPYDVDFSASIHTGGATLSASSGAIASGTDIGFFSVDGSSVASSSDGWAFDPVSNFRIAIDYDLSFASANGVLGIGFGIGEDIAGANIAGVGMLTLNGNPTLDFFGAARVNDVNQVFGTSGSSLGLSASTSGSLFVAYDSNSGDVSVGASSTKGASTPSHTFTMSAIQNGWNEAHLLGSFFLRAETIPGVASGWSSGTADAVFSNFRVLEGEALAVVPEPSGFALVTMGFLCVWGLWYQRKRSLIQ